MSKVREIRESVDKKPDHWEASAAAFEAHLQQTGEQAAARLEVVAMAGRRIIPC